MTNRNKALGSALEYRVVDKAQRLGLPAQRQPLSGVLADFPNDVVVDGYLGECKVRSTHPSYSELQEWLEKCQANAKRKKYKDGFLVYNVKGSKTPRVLCDLDLFLHLLQMASLDNNRSKMIA